MQDNSFSGRGWTGFEKAGAEAKDETKAIANLRSLVASKISEWKAKAEMAKNPDASHELAQQALELKAKLDSLLHKTKEHLNNTEQFAVITPQLADFPEFKAYIEAEKKEIEQLATTLRHKKNKGKGPAKKRKTNRRRNKRHRKSTRRRRRTLKH